MTWLHIYLPLCSAVVFLYVCTMSINMPSSVLVTVHNSTVLLLVVAVIWTIIQLRGAQ